MEKKTLQDFSDDITALLAFSRNFDRVSRNQETGAKTSKELVQIFGFSSFRLWPPGFACLKHAVF